MKALTSTPTLEALTSSSTLRSSLSSRMAHVLDTTMFWSETSGVHRALQVKRELLQRQGWRHTLMAPGANGRNEIDCGGVPLPASKGYKFVVNRERAARLMAEAEPDLIEASDPYVLSWAALDAAQRLNIPAVAFCHSNFPARMAQLISGENAQNRWHGRWVEARARSYLRRLYERFDVVFAPSRFVAGQLREAGLDRVVHQPLGVDCKVFTPQAQDLLWRHQMNKQWGLPSGTRWLIYCGRFSREKNLDVLANAVRLMGPDHLLLVVGSGPRPPQGSQVKVIPTETNSHQLARWIASSDMFVHAGDQETFGLAALEAMACGTPVVVHASGGLGELAQGVGITVDSLHSEQWAQAMRASLEASLFSPASIGIRGLERARQHDWNLIVAQWAQRYQSLIRAHSFLNAPRSFKEVFSSPLPSSAHPENRVRYS